TIESEGEVVRDMILLRDGAKSRGIIRRMLARGNPWTKNTPTESDFALDIGLLRLQPDSLSGHCLHRRDRHRARTSTGASYHSAVCRCGKCSGGVRAGDYYPSWFGG